MAKNDLKCVPICYRKAKLLLVFEDVTRGENVLFNGLSISCGSMIAPRAISAIVRFWEILPCNSFDWVRRFEIRVIERLRQSDGLRSSVTQRNSEFVWTDFQEVKPYLPKWHVVFTFFSNRKAEESEIWFFLYSDIFFSTRHICPTPKTKIYSMRITSKSHSENSGLKVEIVKRILDFRESTYYRKVDSVIFEFRNWSFINEICKYSLHQLTHDVTVCVFNAFLTFSPSSISSMSNSSLMEDNITHSERIGAFFHHCHF